MHIYIKNKNLFIDQYKVKCAIGKRGIGLKKKEGDLITPKGSFKIKTILYRKDRLPRFNTKITKRIIQKNMGWCNDSRSIKYNKLIFFPFNYNAEKLYRKDNIYDIILVLNYNINPVIKNKGSAIFIHIAKQDYKNTEGCIALNKRSLLKIIPKLDKNTQVKIN